MNPNMAMLNNSMNPLNNSMSNGMNNTNMFNGSGSMNSMGMGMGMGMGQTMGLGQTMGMGQTMGQTMGTMGTNMNMMNNPGRLPGSMSSNPLGLTATINSNNGTGRATSVDGLVDQTYLQLSGEASQITHKWRQLQYDATDLQKKKVDLRRQWNDHHRAVAALEDERRRFKEVSQAGFAPKGTEMRVRLNVGGQMFETTASTLTRDAGSMLDALCRDDSPLAQLNNPGQKTEGSKEENEGNGKETKEQAGDGAATTVGVVFIDRDGQLFRHVLNFLRDGVLPSNKTILRSLYREAKYYEIKSLCIEIEKRLGIVAVSFHSLNSPTTDPVRPLHPLTFFCPFVLFLVNFPFLRSSIPPFPPPPFLQLLEPRTGAVDVPGSNVYGSNTTLQPNNGNQQWWERPSDHRGWWPSQRRGQADMSWWTGESYRGQNTTNVLRAYDTNGVGTTTRESNRYDAGYNNSGAYGRSLLRGAPATNTTWDTMGRGVSRRPYDDVYGQRGGGGGRNAIMSSSMSSSLGSNSANVGRYSGLRASGGATRFR